MSSFLAHAMVGFSLSTHKKRATITEMMFVSLFFILLAWSPDIDYLINYLGEESMPIRYTHSIGYISIVSLVAIFFRNILFKKYLYHIPIILFFFASASHLLLDFCVGVHGNPYLYPFSSDVFVAPFGILPSSGRIDIHNYYFWRNMGIELTIFMPIVLFSINSLRRKILNHRGLMFLLFFFFVVGVTVGIGLNR